MAGQKITEAQAGGYAQTLFAEHRPLIWDIRQSPDGEGALDVELYAPEVSGTRATFILTCWLENDQPYGEW